MDWLLVVEEKSCSKIKLPSLSSEYINFFFSLLKQFFATGLYQEDNFLLGILGFPLAAVTRKVKQGNEKVRT